MKQGGVFLTCECDKVSIDISVAKQGGYHRQWDEPGVIRRFNKMLQQNQQSKMLSQIINNNYYNIYFSHIHQK